MTNRIRREPSRPTRKPRGTTARSAQRTETRAHPAILNSAAGTAERITEVRRQEALLKTGA